MAPGASFVLSAFDDMVAEFDISTSSDQDTPELKRKSTEDRDAGPSKRRALTDTFLDRPMARHVVLDGERSSTPTRALPSKGTSLQMENLFPNAFQDTPKRTQPTGAQIQVENAKIGPPLEEALRELGLTAPSDFFPSLEIKLMKHQIIGVCWMLRQEIQLVNRGGMLADEMGLGKTVQIIALMVTNQRGSQQGSLEAQDTDDEPDDEPINKDMGKTKQKYAKSKKSGYSRTTLIVAPASLLRQWKDEIESKCQKDLLRVHIHHGKDKAKSVKELRSYDVVLVSYQTLMADFPKLSVDDKAAWRPDMGGVLARMKWYRVVLDEAQVVRNHNTQSAQSVFLLQAKYRWCLSGTPIFNGISDIYPYLKFCRPGYYNWDYFSRHIVRREKRDPAGATAKANEWLEPMMLRRTKQSRLDGRFILEELPPKDIDIVELEFSEGERRIYDAMAVSVERKVGELVSQGLEEKFHMYILVLILRLRQICNHPCLYLGLKDAMDDSTTISRQEKDKEIARARREMSSQWVDVMKKSYRDKAMKKDQVDGTNAIGTCRGCSEVFTDNAMLIACGHEVCIECLADLAKSELRLDRDMEDLVDDTHLRPCPTCKKLVDPSQAYKSAAFVVSEEELIFSGGGCKNATANSKRQDTLILDSDDEELPDAIGILAGISAPQKKNSTSENHDHDRRSHRISGTSALSQTPVLTHSDTNDLSDDANVQLWKNPKKPSTKLISLINMLKEWECDTESSMDKVIIYSQWTSMLDLVEELFEQYDLTWLRYDGQMGREERDEAIAQFKKLGGPKYILISIKSGSVGLNLTVANRIINLDLSWSLQAEQQAYDRAHRIGQTKPVYIKRFVIKDTIETRLLELQREKQEVAAATLGEGDAPMQRMTSSLTARDLTSLVMPVKGKNKKR